MKATLAWLKPMVFVTKQVIKAACIIFSVHKSFFLLLLCFPV